MAFADLTDLNARRAQPVPEGLEPMATQLLEDASAILRAEVAVDDSDDEQAGLLAQVCCNMVLRAMQPAISDTYGVQQITATTGPFSQAVTYANPNANLYVTKAERRLLGIGGGRGRILHPAYGQVTPDA